MRVTIPIPQFNTLLPLLTSCPYQSLLIGPKSIEREAPDYPSTGRRSLTKIPSNNNILSII